MDPGTTSVIFFPTNFSKPLATRTDVTAVLVRTMSSVCQRSMLRGEPTVWSAYVCQRPVQHALDFTIFAAIATPSLQLARERRDCVPLHFSQARCPTDKSKPRYLRPIFQNPLSPPSELVQGVAMSTAAVTPFRSFVQTPVFSVSPSSSSLQRI